MFCLDLRKCGDFHPLQASINKSSTIIIALFVGFYSSILDDWGGNVGEFNHLAGKYEVEADRIFDFTQGLINALITPKEAFPAM